MHLEPIQYLLGAFSGSLVGLTLGLFGGGGSILAVPLMVYLVGVPSAHVALGTSALAVAANAAANLLTHARMGNVQWRCAGDGRSSAANGPCPSAQRRRKRVISRDSTSSSSASANSSSRESGGAISGMAWRISSGFFCQYRRMNWFGVRPPSSGAGVSGAGDAGAPESACVRRSVPVVATLGGVGVRFGRPPAGWSGDRFGIV